jgi:hypothetical protein
VTVTPTVTSLLGMPVKGDTVLKGSAEGSAVGAVTAAVGIDLPGVLGTGDGATMTAVAHPVGGILASGTEIALGKRPLYGSTYTGKLSYGLEKGAGVWQLSADLLDAKDQKVSSVNGKLEISSTGTLAKGEIHATKVSIFGLFTAEKLDLELSANWSAKAEITYKDGENRDREIKAGATYEVDDKTTRSRRSPSRCPYLTVPGWTILRNVAWTYGGDAAPGWSLKATIDRERPDAPSAEVGGGVVMNSLGTITSASITLKNVPLAGLSTITSATLSLDPGDAHLQGRGRHLDRGGDRRREDPADRRGRAVLDRQRRARRPQDRGLGPAHGRDRQPPRGLVRVQQDQGHLEPVDDQGRPVRPGRGAGLHREQGRRRLVLHRHG